MTERIDIVEALLFASDAPVEAERVREVLDLPSVEEARALLDRLGARLDLHGRPLQLMEVGGGFRLVTRPELAPWLVKLGRSKTRSRLSRPALETLAIVAYRQPVSRPEVDALRGVNSEGVLDNLLERRMIRITGRKESPGRPFLYETTREFLVAFGLRDLGDLPKVEGDLTVPEPAAEATEPEAVSSGDGEREQGAEEAGSAGIAAAPPEEKSVAADSPEQDPGSSGAGLAPRG
jgi:segregation and condensation protein B